MFRRRRRTVTYQFNLPDWFVANYSVTASAPSGSATSSFTDSNATWFNPGSAANFPAEPQPTSGETVNWLTYPTCASGTGTTETPFTLLPSDKTTFGSGGLNRGNSLALTNVQIASGDTSGLVFAYITSDAPTGPKYSVGSCVPITQNGNSSSFYFHYSHRPTAAPQSISATTGVAKTITLTGTDLDGENLTFAKVGTGPTHGTLGAIGAPTCTVKSGGTSTCSANVTYTSTGGYTGPDSFQFTVTDPSTLVSTPATVSITVSQNNASIAGTVRQDSNGNGSFDAAVTRHLRRHGEPQRLRSCDDDHDPRRHLQLHWTHSCLQRRLHAAERLCQHRHSTANRQHLSFCRPEPFRQGLLRSKGHDHERQQQQQSEHLRRLGYVHCDRDFGRR